MKLEKKEIVFPDVPHEGVIGLKMHNMKGERIFSDMEETTWASIWENHTQRWQGIVDEYESNPIDFHNAWQYLNGHPAFWKFRHGPTDFKPLPLAERLHVKHLEDDYGIHGCVNFIVVRINPTTREVEDEGEKNTETEIWIELGHMSWPVEHDPKDPVTYAAAYHDYRLDTGGPTMEAAVIRAAYYVWTVYGNDRRACEAPFDERNYAAIAETPELDEALRLRGDGGNVHAKMQKAAEKTRLILQDIDKELEEEEGE